MFPADQSGLWGLVLSMVGLILFGVTVTLVVDGDLTLGGADASSDAGELEEQEATLLALGLELERLQQLEQDSGERNRISAELENPTNLPGVDRLGDFKG